MADRRGARLHVVTGKGGTGKSTVAAALALALASDGHQVLLCEVEGRQGIARMFDVDPLPYEERRIATGLTVGSGPPPGAVHALHIDAESALLEYLAMYYRLGRAGRALDRFGVIEFATTIAPGVRDVLLTGKVYEAARRNGQAPKGSGRRYDAVVLDAPPTGRIAQFLGVNQELAGLAKMGPIKSQADSIMALFRSDGTRVHLVTVLEEMPVQETVDGITQLREARLPVGSVLVNMVRPRDLDADDLAAARAGEIDVEAVRADLTSVGVDTDDELLDSLLAEARDHAERRALEDAQREVVDRLGVPTYDLPRLASGIDVGALYELAALLKKQGAA
ncbi:ArsA-related P-loop ATPase [Nocardioides bigeumensis]|uniref:ArsA-related P-loop ATPase n=1 Tax=Nocardioides bigeumensis TaxID=433657 RepID=A0ABN2YTD4_9ACTN